MKMPEMRSRTVIDKCGDTLFEVTYESSRGEVVKKTLSAEDYANLIGASLKESRSFWRIRTDFLPEGFVDGCISDENNYSIAFKVKGAQRLLVHTSGSYMIPFPDLLFVLQSWHGYIGRKFCFAFKEGDDRLYRYPFGNVSSNGSICMGNIELDEVRKYGPGMFAELFFMGKTNNDYFHERSHINAKWSQEMLLKKLDGKKKFPEKLLLPTENVMNTISLVKKSMEDLAA